MNSVSALIVGILVALMLAVATVVGKIREDVAHKDAVIANYKAARAAEHPHPDGGTIRYATLRQWYAGQALAGIKSRYGNEPEAAAKEAWAVADAMIAEEHRDEPVATAPAEADGK